MTYHQFIHEVEMKVKMRVDDRVQVRAYVAVKNNGYERRGLVVTEQGINVSPTIYLEEFYQQFQEGNSMDKIVENILNLYQEVRFAKSWDGSWLQSFEQLKSRIVYKVIHRESNAELLKSVPHKLVLDLAVVCYVLLDLDQSRAATMLVKEEHLKTWNVTKEEVFQQAEKNVVRLLPAEFNRMRDVLSDLLQMEQETVEEEDIMYVLSNESRYLGAACILYKGITEMIWAQLNENYYVIPSSIHEMIILPASQVERAELLKKMVEEVNQTQLEEEEILSYQVYYYSYEERKLIIC